MLIHFFYFFKIFILKFLINFECMKLKEMSERTEREREMEKYAEI